MDRLKQLVDATCDLARRVAQVRRGRPLPPSRRTATARALLARLRKDLA